MPLWRFLLLLIDIRIIEAITANVVFTSVRECDTATGSGRHGIQLGELEFRTRDGIRIGISEVINPGGESPGRETAANLIDNDATSKWLDFAMVANGACQTSTLIFSNLPDRPALLALTTANDSPARDPVSLTVEICDDECVIYRFPSVEAPISRFTQYDLLSLMTDPSRSPSFTPVTSIPTNQPTTGIPTNSPDTSIPSSPPTPSEPSPIPSISPVTSEPTPSPNSLECFDTIGWDNSFGMGCKEYETNGWCDGLSTTSWVSGVQFNYPTRNCCVCGKKEYDRYKARLDRLEIENVELETANCEAGISSDEVLRAEKLKTMQKQMRLIEKRLGNHCKSDASLELEKRLRHRMEEVKAYVNEAIKSLLSSLGLSTTTPSPEVWFGQVNGYNQLCELSGSYDTLTLPEDSLEICMQFCQYSETCQALSYYESECLLLHSLPTETVFTSGASCMYKATSSGNWRFENTTDQLCSCAPTVKPTDAPSQSPTFSLPSTSPTNPPSPNPTRTPSLDPTRTPSRTPSFLPTDIPSENPSRQPSRNPSFDPSRAPSTAPTPVPSDSPTPSPTTAPTHNPTTGSPSVSPTVDLEKFEITFIVDLTSGILEGNFAENYASVENFILGVMNDMMGTDNSAALYFYDAWPQNDLGQPHGNWSRAFSFSDYSNTGTSVTSKEYYELLVPFHFDRQEEKGEMGASPSTDVRNLNPNLQLILFDIRDVYETLVNPTWNQHIIVVVLHSLAIAEDFVIPVLFRNGQEDVRIMVVSVGSIIDRTSYLEQYYAWTENGFFFFFEGFDTFTDLNSDAFISWLREKNYPYHTIPD